MTKKQAIQLFEERKVRTVWGDEQEKWYFSIVDVVAVLTEQIDLLKARKYWNKLKQRLVEEGNQTVTNCHQLKMKAADGKMRLTDVADQEQLFRLIQSIPSQKAEPFKMDAVDSAFCNFEPNSRSLLKETKNLMRQYDTEARQLMDKKKVK